MITQRLSRLANFLPAITGALLLCTASVSSTKAETIGLSLPISGDAAELGRDFSTGAKLAMEKFGRGHTLFIADDGCDPDLSDMAAGDLLFKEVAIVTGLLCNEAAFATARQLKDGGIPVLVAGARSIRLIKDRAREEWNLWRMSPGDDDAAKATAKAIAQKWKDIPFAIVDDGTIYGRNFTDTLRILLDEEGVAPQFADSFRAAQSTQAGLLRRLQRSGVKAAFIAATATEDLVTIATNMAELDIKIEVMASDALAVLPFLDSADKIPPGIMVVMEKPNSPNEIDAELEGLGIKPTQYVYAGYAAIQVALKALRKKPGGTSAVLQSTRFETITGPVHFGPDHSNRFNPYALHVWDGENFVSPEKAVQTQ